MGDGLSKVEVHQDVQSPSMGAGTLSVLSDPLEDYITKDRLYEELVHVMRTQTTPGKVVSRKVENDTEAGFTIVEAVMDEHGRAVPSKRVVCLDPENYIIIMEIFDSDAIFVRNIIMVLGPDPHIQVEAYKSLAPKRLAGLDSLYVAETLSQTIDMVGGLLGGSECHPHWRAVGLGRHVQVFPDVLSQGSSSSGSSPSQRSAMSERLDGLGYDCASIWEAFDNHFRHPRKGNWLKDFEVETIPEGFYTRLTVATGGEGLLTLHCHTYPCVEERSFTQEVRWRKEDPPFEVRHFEIVNCQDGGLRVEMVIVKDGERLSGPDISTQFHGVLNAIISGTEQGLTWITPKASFHVDTLSPGGAPGRRVIVSDPLDAVVEAQGLTFDTFFEAWLDLLLAPSLETCMMGVSGIPQVTKEGEGSFIVAYDLDFKSIPLMSRMEKITVDKATAVITVKGYVNGAGEPTQVYKFHRDPLRLEAFIIKDEASAKEDQAFLLGLVMARFNTLFGFYVNRDGAPQWLFDQPALGGQYGKPSANAKSIVSSDLAPFLGGGPDAAERLWRNLVQLPLLLRYPTFSAVKTALGIKSCELQRLSEGEAVFREVLDGQKLLTYLGQGNGEDACMNTIYWFDHKRHELVCQKMVDGRCGIRCVVRMHTQPQLRIEMWREDPEQRFHGAYLRGEVQGLLEEVLRRVEND